MKKIRLGVNIDHVANIRNARGDNYPSPLRAALLAQKNGADSVTIHLREDRRHIQDQDVIDIRATAKVLNLEMALTEEMVNICINIKPDYCCIVPEKREELTTEGGLDLLNMTDNHFNFLVDAIDAIHKNGSIVSLFIDPDIQQIDRCINSGAKCIELHTGSYANAMSSNDKNNELNRIKDAANYASKYNLQVHAGHGLNLSNL